MMSVTLPWPTVILTPDTSCPCPDIGWSPYFPILAGVVTELGGLISHGAVVAREYGLPCLVGAQHATNIFQDGDTVCLDAVRGELVKVVVNVEK